MATRYTEEFRRDAVRIATTSGLTRPQVSSDWGLGVSTLNKWIQRHQHDDLMSGSHEDAEKENQRLRKKVRLLREKILAHIREQHALSLQNYGQPRMTEKLQEPGLNVGHRRVGRLMRENGIKIIRTQKYKATTDSNPAFNIAPSLLDQDFFTDAPNQKWAGDMAVGLRKSPKGCIHHTERGSP
jgi:putative transposase